MDPFSPPPSAHHVAVQDGEAFIWESRPGIVIQKARGILSPDLAHCFADFYRVLFMAGRHVTIFDDFEEVSQYTREAREYLTDFTLEWLPQVEVIHFLMSSKFLALGVGAFKLDVGAEHVSTYADRKSFLESYAAAVRGKTRGGSRGAS
jgi:hypothetical protein